MRIDSFIGIHRRRGKKGFSSLLSIAVIPDIPRFPIYTRLGHITDLLASLFLRSSALNGIKKYLIYLLCKYRRTDRGLVGHVFHQLFLLLIWLPS